MKQGLNNDIGVFKGLLAQMAAEKKKFAIAFSLIGLMVFMWVKVFISSGPKSASAAAVGEQEGSSENNEQLNVCYVELPRVEGRNDSLSGDFFVVERWEDFLSGRGPDSGEVDVVSKKGGEKLAEKIGEKLKLHAIELGHRPRAFVNDKLLGPGDVLVVRDGTGKYECEVIEIENNKVFIRCQQAEIVLKLANQIEIPD